MRQKYFISREGVKNKLNIREYAIIQKALKNVASSMPSKETFSFLGQETYDGSIIMNSIKNGLDALVATLRTRNLFPIGPHAIKIAESVMELYDSEGDCSVELFFNDVDLFEKKPLLESG
jgi:hypothetical protein